MPSRRLRALAILTAAACIAGCASVRIEMFVRAPAPPPTLTGKTVAVLPALAVGTEGATAARCLKAQNRALAGEINGVRFLSPQDLLPRCREHADAFADIEEKTTAKIPTDAEPAGLVRTLFSGEVPPGMPHEGEFVVTLQEESAGVAPLGPDALPAETLGKFGGDYVLVTATFTCYRETTEITALYGLLPIFGTVVVHDLTPRALCVLFDTASGAKVWEGCVGALSKPNASALPLGLDPRDLPVLGAAYLLTGDIQEPLSRLAYPR